MLTLGIISFLKYLDNYSTWRQQFDTAESTFLTNFLLDWSVDVIFWFQTQTLSKVRILACCFQLFENKQFFNSAQSAVKIAVLNLDLKIIRQIYGFQQRKLYFPSSISIKVFEERNNTLMYIAVNNSVFSLFCDSYPK